MTEIVSIKQKTTLSQKPVILVMGGSRGSSFINEEIVNIAPKLLKKYKLIHISGEAEYQKIREFDGGDYKVLSFVDPREMYRYYEMSDLIISRSGANTVSEITFIKRPSILIPLPRTYLNEQIKNAKYAEDYGIAKVMLETEVNPDSLTKTIEHIFENWHTIVGKTLEKESLDARGAANLVDLLLNYI
jgi:UDP-N-acetylglucosamine--N-acetylmuramyl-(pentapeptide) pyrophosphoryl-undecaprenol N-acetylglucosamine transferase